MRKFRVHFQQVNQTYFDAEGNSMAEAVEAASKTWKAWAQPRRSSVEELVRGPVYVGTRDMEETSCPLCGQLVDAMLGVTSESRAKMTVGSIAICGYCGAMLTFHAGLGLRMMDPVAAARAVEADPVLALALDFVRERIAESKEKS